MNTRIPDPEESVRRMLHAKPSMNAIVVQLLVDLSWINSGGTALSIARKKTFTDRSLTFSYLKQQGSGKDQPLSRL
jgi:hypothetical protein